MTKKRYNVMLNPLMVWRLDVYAEQNGSTRSKLLNSMLSDWLLDKYGAFDSSLRDQIDDDQMVFQDERGA